MGVAIDQAWQYRLSGKVDDFCAGWNFHIASKRFDLFAAQQNDLLLKHPPVLDVNQVPSLDRCDRFRFRRLLTASAVRAERRKSGKEQESEFQVILFQIESGTGS
jgi:hypothetical protein